MKDLKDKVVQFLIDRRMDGDSKNLMEIPSREFYEEWAENKINGMSHMDLLELISDTLEFGSS